MNIKDVKIFENFMVNGHVINADELQKYVSEMNKEPMIGGIFIYEESNSEDITHITHNFRIEPKHMLVDIKVLDTPKGKEIQKLLSETNVPQSELFIGAIVGEVNDSTLTDISKITTVSTLEPENFSIPSISNN